VKDDLYTVPVPTLEELPRVEAGKAGDEETVWIGGMIVDGEGTVCDASVDVDAREALDVDKPVPLAMTPELARHWE
jgi:hypothetical protein